MRHPHQPDDNGITPSLRSSLAMLVFGLSILAYLIAIDRADWFHLRPGTGTAAAMSEASRPAPPPGES